MFGVISEYMLLSLSLVFMVIETIASGLTVLLPNKLIDGISGALRLVLPRSKAEKELEEDKVQYEKVKRMRDAISFIDMCEIHGYRASEHIVGTADGYMLGIHRILPSIKRRGLVYLHHGLLMNSEIWVANINPQESIALRLVEAGYEVWLGNNRGNKYSKKHISRNPLSREFWNFCIDEFALYDIPAAIDYILNITGEKSLAYLGFSQGSAQAFAALSIHPKLNEKIHLFIALGPAMNPPSVGPRLLHSLITASPNLLFTLLGHRVVLRSTVFWQSIILPSLFIKMIDLSNRVLFNWNSNNISWAQKLTSYYHLYSYTSVKCVVHWFQIIARNNGLQMYDDDTFGILGTHLSESRYYQVSPYPTKNITTPIEIIYGTKDTLVDIDSLLSKLPAPAGVYPVEDYEHLEMIWGHKVPSIIIPRILNILVKHSPVEQPREIESAPRSIKDAAETSVLYAVSSPKLAEPYMSPDSSHSLLD